ncbi:hypothetical protein NM22_01075 [Vibrio tubiashii]|nr:hypothetical protein NM22_01075 [Vibrio tubiashii]
MRIVSLVVLLLLSGFAQASDYGEIPQTFFSKISTGAHSQAIDYLYDTNKWMAKNSDQVLNLKSQLESLDGLVGQYQFHELISETKVGANYAHLIYLVGYERQPLRFELQLYRVNGTWLMLGVSFDARLTNDISTLANQNLLDTNK